MFPIADTAGRTIGFSGRIFGGGDTEAAKYINSPETDIYKKSHVLFGFDKARQVVREKKRIVVVEGQMDLILSHQAGYTETVAVSGTALTGDQVDMMHRLTQEIIFAFDGDDAGIAAAERSARIALSAGMDVKMTVLPEGEDPADVIGKSTEAWEKILSGAPHIIDFFTARWKEKGKDMRGSALLVSEHVIPLIALIPNALERDHFMQSVAGMLSTSVDAVRAEVEKHEFTPGYEGDQIGTHTSTRDSSPVSRRRLHEEYMIGILEWQKSATDPTISIDEALTRMSEVVEGIEALLDSVDEGARTRLAFEAEERCVQGDISAKDEWEEQFALWRKAVLAERKAAIHQALQDATYGDADTTELMKEYQDIIIRMEKET